MHTVVPAYSGQIGQKSFCPDLVKFSEFQIKLYVFRDNVWFSPKNVVHNKWWSSLPSILSSVKYVAQIEILFENKP